MAYAQSRTVLQNQSTGAALIEVGAVLTKKRVTVEVTRPSDTTAYAAKDTIANATSGATVWTFPAVARAAAGSGYIVGCNFLTDKTGVTDSFKLHLYNGAPTALQDNAACTAPLYADSASYIGTIIIPAATGEGSGATASYSTVTPNTASSNLPLPYVCNADANLYGILEAVTGFTPASGQKITITLTTSID